MSKPARFQLSRRKGYRKPEGAIVVSRPSKWGNPLLLKNYPDAAACVADYRSRLQFGYITPRRDAGGGYHRINKDTIRAELRGRDLLCWCKPGDPCHADVLLEIANE